MFPKRAVPLCFPVKTYPQTNVYIYVCVCICECILSAIENGKVLRIYGVSSFGDIISLCPSLALSFLFLKRVILRFFFFFFLSYSFCYYCCCCFFFIGLLVGLFLSLLLFNRHVHVVWEWREKHTCLAASGAEPRDSTV